jgi:hypothetical protein
VLSGFWCTLPSPIESRWTPHIPPKIHGVQVESMWISTNIAYFGNYGMDSRWSPGGIQLEFVKMKKKHLFDKLKWILRSRKLIYHAYI